MVVATVNSIQSGSGWHLPPAASIPTRETLYNTTSILPEGSRGLRGQMYKCLDAEAILAPPNHPLRTRPAWLPGSGTGSG